MTKQNSKMVYVIMDSNNRYEGHLNINSNNMETGKGDYAWDYFSKIYPTSWNPNRAYVQLKLDRLLELNTIAHFNLTWEIVELTEQEIIDRFKAQALKDKELGISAFLSSHNNLSIEMKPIQKGCVTLHRKAVNAIYRKYKQVQRLEKVA
jgi:hypothetical protein